MSRPRAPAAAPLEGLREQGPVSAATAAAIAAGLREARARTLALHEDLPPEHWLGPRLSIVNPPLWELGHVGWFQEWWCLRAGGAAPSLRPDADALYDSGAVPHRTRWDLPLPSPDAARAYLAAVLERVLDALAAREVSAAAAYFARLALFHEDMHDEAFLYTRQTHGLPPPAWLRQAPVPAGAARAAGPGRRVRGGHAPAGGRAGSRGVRVRQREAGRIPSRWPRSRMARHAVTEGEFAAFVGRRRLRAPRAVERGGLGVAARARACARRSTGSARADAG